MTRMQFPGEKDAWEGAPESFGARISWQDLPRLNKRFQNGSALDVLSLVARSYPGQCAFACSFGLEDMVLLDHLARLEGDPIRIFTLDTGRLPDETYAMWDLVQDRYKMKLEITFPDAQDIRQFVESHGANSIFSSIEDRKRCCFLRKVKPLRAYLQRAGAWITGLRREQSTGRAHVDCFQWDIDNGGLLKVNPLWAWTEKELFAYVEERDVPVHAWHHKGIPSIGCAPCTRPVPGWSLGGANSHLDLRQGRWWWEEETAAAECGLHAHAPPAASIQKVQSPAPSENFISLSVQKEEK